MAVLSNDLMGYVTGTTINVDGGLKLFSWIDFPEAWTRRRFARRPGG